MKNRIKLISLLLVLLLGISVLSACGGGVIDDSWKPTGADVTIVSTNQPMSPMYIYATGDTVAKEAANKFKTSLSKNKLPQGNAVYSADALSESKEILFGATDRIASQKAQALLDEKVKAAPNDYHWVFYYRDGKLAIVANSAIAYELAIDKLFSTYVQNGALKFKDSLNEHGVVTAAEYEAYLEELDRIALEKRKEENAILLQGLLPIVDAQREEFKTIKGKWNTYDEVSASNPEILLFMQYTENIGTTTWGPAPSDPIDEHPRLLLTADKIPTIREMLKQDTATNEYFLTLVDIDVANDGLLPPPSYKGENTTVTYVFRSVKCLDYILLQR